MLPGSSWCCRVTSNSPDDLGTSRFTFPSPSQRVNSSGKDWVSPLLRPSAWPWVRHTAGTCWHPVSGRGVGAASLFGSLRKLSGCQGAGLAEQQGEGDLENSFLLKGQFFPFSQVSALSVFHVKLPNGFSPWWELLTRNQSFLHVCALSTAAKGSPRAQGSCPLPLMRWSEPEEGVIIIRSVTLDTLYLWWSDFINKNQSLCSVVEGETHGIRQKSGRRGHDVHGGVTGPSPSPVLRVSRVCSPLLKVPQRLAGLIEHRASLASYSVRRAEHLDLGLNSGLCYLLTYDAGRVGGHLCVSPLSCYRVSWRARALKHIACLVDTTGTAYTLRLLLFPQLLGTGWNDHFIEPNQMKPKQDFKKMLK